MNKLDTQIKNKYMENGILFIYKKGNYVTKTSVVKYTNINTYLKYDVSNYKPEEFRNIQLV